VEALNPFILNLGARWGDAKSRIYNTERNIINCYNLFNLKGTCRSQYVSRDERIILMWNFLNNE